MLIRIDKGLLEHLCSAFQHKKCFNLKQIELQTDEECSASEKFSNEMSELTVEKIISATDNDGVIEFLVLW